MLDQDKIAQYQQLHSQDQSYGSTSLKFIDEVTLMIDILRPASVLDYGCGKGALIDEIQNRHPEIACHKYDPSIPEYSTIPVNNADFVINTDVLEHIPVDDIDAVLAEIASISERVYFNLHHGRAATILPSGENAHCTIRSPNWYLKKLRKYFKNVEMLPGRRYITSVAITFPITDAVRREYLTIVNDRKIKAPLMLHIRFVVKNFIRDYLGIQINK